MNLLSGKTEIVYLLGKVIEKYEQAQDVSIVKNSNRKNYEPIAKILSAISAQLPYTADNLLHDIYPPDHNPQNAEYPFRKYDITGNQIKDAYFNQIVSNPRPFLVDACYIYLYGMGRKGFEQNPVDENLIASSSTPIHIENTSPLSNQAQNTPKYANTINKVAIYSAFTLLLSTVFCLYKWLETKQDWATIKSDMKIMPYTPTQTEIDSLEGVWLSYIGSPQARISDANRYHLFAANVVEIKYINGYFKINRYGANFDHEGYAQFESPYLVSLHTFVKNKYGQVESPRHSIMRLNKDKEYKNVISTSWNFDVAEKNDVIGIREVYKKQGKGGNLEEILNTVENGICKCKILKWEKNNGEIVIFELKNQLLDTVSVSELKNLINENSILLRIPTEGLLLKDSIQ